MGGDAELQLDIRAELASHLEDAVDANLAAGMSRSEAHARALEALGPNRELALELGMANHQRMGLRSVARLVLARVLVPASLVLAIVIAGHSYSRLSRLSALASHLQASAPPNPLLTGVDVPEVPGPTYISPVDRLPADKAFFYHGDLSRPTLATQQRAIWESDPQNRVFFGNYISVLSAYRDFKPGELLSELDAASGIDPDNARYPMLTAVAMIRQAREDGAASFPPEVYDYLEQAAGMPYYRRYQLAMLMKRMSLLGPVRRLEDQVERWNAGRLQTDRDMHYAHDAMSALVAGAEQRATIGDPEGARQLLSLWKPLFEMLAMDTITDGDVGALQELASYVEQSLTPPYESLGLTEEAALVKADAREIQQAIFDNRLAASEKVSSFVARDLATKGSLFSQLIGLDLVKSPYPGVLEDGFWAEHLILEQMALALLMAVLVVLMIISLAIWGRWRARIRHQPVPGVLLLKGAQFVRLFGLTVILPLFVYGAYSRWAASVWQYSKTYEPERFLFEALLLLVTIVSLYGWVSARMIHRRCSELRLDVPAQSGPWGYMILWGCSMGLWGVFLIMRSNGEVPIPLIRSASMVILFMAAAMLAGGFLVQLVGRPRVAFYRVTCARTLVAFYAMAILFLGAIVLPLLERQELRHLENQRLYAEFEKNGFMNMEQRQVSEIRKDIQRILSRNREKG